MYSEPKLSARWYRLGHALQPARVLMRKTTLFVAVALTTHAPLCVNAQNAISVGIDTALFESEFGDGHPDRPSSGGPGFHIWEWDGVNGGGQNHGLLWFDIPQNVLDRFGNGTAALVLQVSNGGDSGDVHRITVDWLSGPDGSDNVTWNNFPGGPGLVPGDNVEKDPSFLTEPVPNGEVEFDVTDDVLAWASGTPNYGWGFIPTDAPRLGNGVNVRSFESGRGPVLMLELGDIPGDFDGNGLLDATDIDLLSAAVREGDSDMAFDLNDDGAVNDVDRATWVEDLSGTFFGDAGLNKEVAFADFLALSSNFGLDGGWAEGNFDGQGNIAFADFLLLSANFGKSATAAAAVPEPSAATLLLLGLVGLLRRRSIVSKKVWLR